MIVTKKEFQQFEKAKNYIFKASEQPILLARVRWELTNLSIDKYIYIADHYTELREKYEL